MFQCHDQYHHVLVVSTEVVDEGRVRRDLALAHPELPHDDALDLLCDVRHGVVLRWRLNG
jgi:hypothetical protein